MKGSMLDTIPMMALFLAGSLAILICLQVLTAFDSNFPVDAQTPHAQYVINRGLETFSMFDYMFLFYTIGIGLFVIVSSFFIDTHPVFFVFGVLLLLPIIIFMGAQISNIFYEFATADVMASVANQFPYTVIIMSNLPTYFLLIGLLIAIVMYVKPSERSTGV